MSPKISIILPAFNEGATIANSIRETRRALADFDQEIIVVDDGSTDDTYAQAQQAASNDPCVQVIHYRPNCGKGHAIKQGFARATGDLVAFLDADNDLHPSQLLVLWQVMERDHADVVIGSKLHPESKLSYPLGRRFVSWGYFNLVHFFFGLPVHDTQTGIKLFRRQVLEQVFPHLQIAGFAFDLELLVGVHFYGYSIAEAPVVVNFQPNDTHALNVFRASIKIAWDTLRVFYWTSFWKWVNPSFSLTFWIIALVIGLVGGSIGLGHLLNNFALPAPLDSVVNVLLLRFVDRIVRDVILLVGGIVLLCVSAVQVNKQIVMTFTRKGRTDLWEQKGK